MTEQRWWERHSGRLDDELRRLTEAGIAYTIDDKLRSRQGILRLSMKVPVDGKTRLFHVVFPDLYPFFRFEILAPEEKLSHHQNPFGMNLCLIGRSTHYWNTDDTVEKMVAEQLPQVFHTANEVDASRLIGKEEVQAEPLSDYYPYLPSMLLVDGNWKLPPAERSGSLLIGIHPQPQVKGNRGVIQGAVLEIRNDKGAALAVAGKPILQLFSPHTVKGRWIRASNPILVGDPREFLRQIRQIGGGSRPPSAFDNGLLEIWGILFPEEVGHRVLGDGWVFVCGHERKAVPSQARRYLLRTTKETRSVAYFSRAGRGGRADIHARMPELQPLASKTVSLFGLGCLGAPNALEMARAGIGEIRILDVDIVDPAASGRWPIGLSACGLNKTDVLKASIQRDYPHTKVLSINHRLGVPRTGELGDPPPDESVMGRMTSGSSLILDATAELGVQNYLSNYAKELRIPYVCVTGTNGGWGGIVVRVDPKITKGCWLCYRHMLNDNSVLFPPHLEQTVQPAGCADPTFTGAGFDLVQVALFATRTVVSTLCAGSQRAYPPMDWDILTVAFRNEAGVMIPPRIAAYRLEKHPKCPNCK